MAHADQPASSTDVTAILTADHKDMRDLLAQVHLTSDPEQRRNLVDTATAEVMRHSVAEEMYVYPVMEEHLPNGAEEVEHDKKEHDELVKVMKELEGVDAANPDFIDLVKKFEEMLAHHAKDEEEDQFPKLRAHLPREQLEELGEKVEQAKKLAPTRPHPSAPHSELFHKTVGAGVGMVDRLRDKLTGRAT